MTALLYPGEVRWLLLLAAGCYQPSPQAGAPCGAGDSCPSGLTCQAGFCQLPGSGATDAAGDPDSPFDSPIVPPDACTSFATQVDTCTLSPGAALTLDAFHTYDTTAHELRDINGTLVPTTSVVITGLAGPIDVLLVESFSLPNASLRVIGDLPFGIISVGGISIGGVIDANGKGGGGAGRRGFVACGDAVGRAGTSDGDGSSGGGGGAHGGNGGNGGEGDTNGSPVAAGIGGSKITLPLGPLGGCRGGIGGGDVNAAPGQGGGAVYLVARGAISIGGIIDAGGGAGEHGHAISGAGGGGGSGGMIVLEGATVQVTGILAANGGGGGGGADNIADAGGNDGTDGRRDTERAAGGDGAGTAEGGDGGSGGALLDIDGAISNEMADNGGGGGGGGCGFIAIGSANPSVSGTVSPALSQWPTP